MRLSYRLLYRDSIKVIQILIHAQLLQAPTTEKRFHLRAPLFLMPRFRFFFSNFHHFTFFTISRFISSVIYLSLRHLYCANKIKIGAYEAPIPNYSHHFPSLFFWFSCRFIGLKCTQTLLGGGRSAPSKQIIKLVTQLPSDSWLHYFFRSLNKKQE